MQKMMLRDFSAGRQGPEEQKKMVMVGFLPNSFLTSYLLNRSGCNGFVKWFLISSKSKKYWRKNMIYTVSRPCGKT